MKLIKTLNIALVSFAIYKIAKGIHKISKDEDFKELVTETKEAFKDLFKANEEVHATDMYFDEAVNGDKLEPQQG